MCAYKVLLTERALNDLSVLPPMVRNAIVQVVDTELHIWPREGNPDEGVVPDFWSSYTGVQPSRGLRWRRAILPETRYGLDAGLALDPALERAAESVILYLVEPLPPRHGRVGSGLLRALRVFPNTTLAAATIRLLLGARDRMD